MKRTDRYQPDFLESTRAIINEQLEHIEQGLIEGFSSPKKPVVFIIGAPRSGSTLAHQLFAYTGVFGYISNFIARFWGAPLLGAIQQKNIPLQTVTDFFSSDLGRTQGIQSPHHFGRFWKRFFHWNEDHRMTAPSSDEVTTLRREVAALETFFDRPMIFRSDYCGLQIPILKRIFPTAKFVVCIRNTAYQAQSLIFAREKYFGTREKWFSLKPAEYSELIQHPPYLQVAGQIRYIVSKIMRDLEDINTTDYMFFILENAWPNPHGEIRYLTERLLGTTQFAFTTQFPSHFQNQNKIRLPETEWNKLEHAIIEVDKWLKK